MNMRIFDELVVGNTDSISLIGTPSKVMLEGVNFTGRIEYLNYNKSIATEIYYMQIYV